MVDIKTQAIEEIKNAVKEYMYSLGIQTGRSSLDDSVCEKVANMIYGAIRVNRTQREKFLNTESARIKKLILEEMGRIIADP